MGIDKRGRVAVVTGAAEGLGQAYAERLALDGADVAIADVADATETLERVRRHGHRALAVSCDLSRQDSVDAFAQEVLAKLGRVDILVNNAGIYPEASFEDTTPELWRRVMAVNLDGPFYMCRALVAGMRERAYGRIVNVSSQTFFTPSMNYAPYIASKGGVIGLTRAIATEYGRYGVTANVIAPGLVRTPNNERSVDPSRYDLLVERQSIKRVAEPADLVGALSFLTSDDAAFVTGQTLLVNGGYARI